MFYIFVYFYEKPVCFEEFTKVDDIYLGINYACFNNNKLNKITEINCTSIKTFIKIVDGYEIGDIVYYSNFSNLVYAESENLKFVAAMMRISDITIINECELLSKHIVELRKIAPFLLPI